MCSPVGQNPDIVLFATLRIERDAANKAIRDAGLSGLHNIRQVNEIEELPLLGTGKLHYKALECRLVGAWARNVPYAHSRREDAKARPEK